MAAFFTACGLALTADQIEPLQLVRYTGGEYFGPHHDYHSTGKSSVQGEQRVFTLLLFGSTVSADAGGETHFPELGVHVWPRGGDALAWSNVDAHGAHERRVPVNARARPPP